MAVGGKAARAQHGEGVRAVLTRLKLEQYAHAFEVHAIDGYMCDFLDDDIDQTGPGVR